MTVTALEWFAIDVQQFMSPQTSQACQSFVTKSALKESFFGSFVTPGNGIFSHLNHLQCDISKSLNHSATYNLNIVFVHFKSILASGKNVF